MARLREGRANTARGAAHFLTETIGRVRSAGATGQLTMRAQSGLGTLLRSALAGALKSPDPGVRIQPTGEGEVHD
jgi:hypothetical protein